MQDVMHGAVMSPTQQREIRQRRRAATAFVAMLKRTP